MRTSFEDLGFDPVLTPFEKEMNAEAKAIEEREIEEAKKAQRKAERKARKAAGEPEQEKPETEKNCGSCTLLNRIDAEKCSVCETAFDAETIKPMPEPEKVETDSSPDEGELTKLDKAV